MQLLNRHTSVQPRSCVESETANSADSVMEVEDDLESGENDTLLFDPR